MSQARDNVRLLERRPAKREDVKIRSSVGECRLGASVQKIEIKSILPIVVAAQQGSIQERAWP
jgi:hypothetical protein